jgi:hypothetical protein
MTQPSTLTGQDIAEAFGAIQALQDQTLAGSPATSGEFVALRVLAARGPVESPASLHDYLAGQRQLALSPAETAELLAGLQARGLATGTAKDGPGPAELTPEGTQTLRSLAETVAPTTRELFSGMTPQELATAHHVLRQIIDRADRIRRARAR